jgi:hypothetical protein
MVKLLPLKGAEEKLLQQKAQDTRNTAQQNLSASRRAGMFYIAAG